MSEPVKINCIATRDGWAAGRWRRAGELVQLAARDLPYEPLLERAPKPRRKRKAAAPAVQDGGRA
jgi:hypothetical protein